MNGIDEVAWLLEEQDRKIAALKSMVVDLLIENRKLKECEKTEDAYEKGRISNVRSEERVYPESFTYARWFPFLRGGTFVSGR